jgi:hypothetical protein
VASAAWTTYCLASGADAAGTGDGPVDELAAGVAVAGGWFSAALPQAVTMSGSASVAAKRIVGINPHGVVVGKRTTRHIAR